jgi:hypothetical protein
VLYEDDDVLGGGWIHEVGGEAGDGSAERMPDVLASDVGILDDAGSLS